MQNKWLYFIVLSLITTGCNLYGGIDSPSGDPQILAAARACLDAGDYPCAKEKYAALSSDMADIKVSETTYTNLADNNIFSIKDLVGSLGSSRGGIASIITLTQLMAANGKTDGATRLKIQTEYAADATISDPSLKAFMQLLVSMSMFEETLATAVGGDGVLTASDIVDSANLTACRADTLLCTGCTSSKSTLSNTATEPSDLSTAAHWDTAATLTKLQLSATAATTALGTLAPNNTSLQGILKILNDLNSALVKAAQYAGPQATTVIERCERQALLNVLFP